MYSAGSPIVFRECLYWIPLSVSAFPISFRMIPSELFLSSSVVKMNIVRSLSTDSIKSTNPVLGTAQITIAISQLLDYSKLLTRNTVVGHQVAAA